MKKRVRIQEALVNHRLSAYLLDFLTLVIGTVALFFVFLYTIFYSTYVPSKEKVSKLEQEYCLNLEAGLDYKEYEEVIQNIYINIFNKEITEEYKRKYGKDLTATHIYNIVILRLPVNPTVDNYKTELHSYVQNPDGTFNTDVVGKELGGSGFNYKNSIESLFYNSYKRMSQVVEGYNKDYYDLNVKIYHAEAYSRMISFILMFIFVFIVMPLKNKESSTLWEMKYGIGHVNVKNGYLVSKWKIILRNFLTCIIPFIGITIANKYSIIILFVGYLLLDSLLMLFSHENLGIADKLLRMESCSIKESLLFVNKEEEEEFWLSDEGRRIDDTEFLSKLQKAEEINIKTYEEGDK